jgi:hypothetical protein
MVYQIGIGNGHTILATICSGHRQTLRPTRRPQSLGRPHQNTPNWRIG